MTKNPTHIPYLPCPRNIFQGEIRQHRCLCFISICTDRAPAVSSNLDNDSNFSQKLPNWIEMLTEYFHPMLIHSHVTRYLHRSEPALYHFNHQFIPQHTGRIPPHSIYITPTYPDLPPNMLLNASKRLRWSRDQQLWLSRPADILR